MDPISTANMKDIAGMVLTQQLMPEQWKKDYIIAKGKKRGAKEPTQHRGIFLINTMAKWLMQIVTRR
eukprot:8295443-Prorocentrum_lima.AAC.1